MKFISLDQSTKKTGWCLWVDGKYHSHGLIDLSEEKDSVIRFKKMSACIWIEDTAMQSNAKTLKDLAQLQGVIFGYCISNDIDYGVISPSKWRNILELPSGRGIKRPELKKNSINYVTEKYGITPSEDECEAITIGAAVLKNFEDKKGDT